MKKYIFTALAVLLIFSANHVYAKPSSKTVDLCYSGHPFRLDRGFDACDDYCITNGYRGADEWRCGSKINCNDSRCICTCRKYVREYERNEPHKEDDRGVFKIPLGDNLNLELRP